MSDDPKEKKKQSGPTVRTRGAGDSPAARPLLLRRLNAADWLNLVGTQLQLLLGLAVVAASIIGLIRPYWLGTIFAILASANVMLAVARLYFLFTSDRLSGSLISRAIRYAVRSRN